MNSEAYVHLGQWTNWADGAYKGPRITLTESGGAYMIAFLALFVRLAGQHSWGILCYIIFRYRQKSLTPGYGQSMDPMQSILRNMNVDTTAAWQFLRLKWRLPSSETSLFRRSILCAVVAVLHAAIFVAAGVFVSKVTATGRNEVLIRGPACGVWQDFDDYNIYDNGTEADLTENASFQSWAFNIASMAAEFSRQCYNTTAANSALANCNAYAPNLLPWEVSEDISCPFDAKMCQNGTAIRFDSGHLDSLHHFGINAEAHDRIKYRRVVQCSPIARDGYVSGILDQSQISWGTEVFKELQGVQQQPNTAYQEFNYGPNTSFNLTATYIYNNYTLTSPNYGNMQAPDYLVDVELYMPQSPDWGTFLAIDELNQTDADVVLYFLLQSPSILYNSAINDPWFRATSSVPYFLDISDNGVGNGTIDVYQSDYYASVMGCTQQFQYCNHDASKCSILTSEGYGGSLVDSISAFAKGLDLNIKQQSALSRIAQASWNLDMYVVGISPSGLLAQASAAGILSSAFPDNQWILEMQHYFLSGLTGVQMQIASYATGPPDRNHYQYLTKPTAEEQWMCSSQIVQRSGYSTFSLLGIIIVIVLGGLIIITNLALPSVASRFDRRTESESTNGWDEYHHLHTCSGYNDLEAKIHATETPDTPWMKARHPLVTVNDWSDPGSFDSSFAESNAMDRSFAYENDIPRNLDLTTKSKRLPQWYQLRHMYRKPGDEGSELMVNVQRGQN